MKITALAILFFCSFLLKSFADTTLSHDNEGLKHSQPAYGLIRSATLGTKGFKCFSTLTKISWEVKATLVDGNTVPFKYFLNENETLVYPVTDKFFQFQNSPISKTPTVSKVCLRAYSSSSSKTANGIFQ